MTCYTCYREQQYVPFKLVTLKKDKFIIQRDLQYTEREKMARVLMKNGIPFKVDRAGKIWVPAEVWEDQAEMWTCSELLFSSVDSCGVLIWKLQ